MGHYVVNFTVYTLAMSGLIFFAFFVYKKVMQGTTGTKKSKEIIIEETLSINARKSLIVVKVGKERFLIASDVDKTSLISKLEDSQDKAFTKSIPQKSELIEDEFEQIYPNEENNFSDLMSTLQENFKAQDMEDLDDDNKTVHLEVIKDRNPKSVRKTSRQHNIIEKKNNEDFSPIKGIVQKVNNI